MQAVIQTGAKQFIVKEGDEISVEKLEVEAGQEVVITEVLALLDGQGSQFGAPTIEGASVKTQVLAQTKGEKIRISTFKPKKGLRHHQGHRQKYTLLKVISVNTGN